MLMPLGGQYGATVVQVEKSFSNQKVASSIPCRCVLEQDTEPLIAPDVPVCHQCKCKMCIHCKSHICKSLWITASASRSLLILTSSLSLSLSSSVSLTLLCLSQPPPLSRSLSLSLPLSLLLSPVS